VRTILVGTLQTQISDPRVQGVTITQVTVTPDTTRADVYYSVLGDEEERLNAQQGLESAAGRLRREVGAQTRLRNTPALVFHWDPSLEYGEHIEQLLDGLGLGQEDDAEAHE
jgi:ribosome-binding factor A